MLTTALSLGAAVSKVNTNTPYQIMILYNIINYLSHPPQSMLLRSKIIIDVHLVTNYTSFNQVAAPQYNTKY